MRCAALVLLALPACLGAQTVADSETCDRVGDARHPEARTTAQQAVRAGGARGTFFNGCLLLADDRFSQAADEFERAIQIDDRNAVAHFYLGRAYGAQAQRANIFKQASLAKKTKHEFDRAVQLDPEFLDARQGLMEYYLQAPGIMGGSKDRARNEVEEIRHRNPYRGGILASQVAGREKDVTGAMRELTRLTTQFPDSANPWYSLAFTQAGQKQWDAAFATIERMQKTVPAHAMLAEYALGRLAAESGQQLDRGEQALKKYLGYTPKTGEPPIANAHWRLGTIYEKRGTKDAARAEYQLAVSLDPKLTPAKDALAKLK